MQCYEVMECDERALIDEWMCAWPDIVAFEAEPVMRSAEASARSSGAAATDP